MIILPAQLTGLSPRADESWSLRFVTRELSQVEAASILPLHMRELCIALKETDISDDEAMSLPDVRVERGDRSPAQRLRGVLYRLWQQRAPEDTRSADEYYLGMMNKIIDHYKGLI